MSLSHPVILVADDEAETRSYLALNLEARSFTVLKGGDGAEALRIFEERHVDLVLLDVNMPRMGGFDVCQKVREMSDVPIILMSAGVEEPNRITAMELGANDYLVKPFGVRELMASVGAVLQNR